MVTAKCDRPRRSWLWRTDGSRVSFRERIVGKVLRHTKVTDFLIVLNSRSAIRSFMSAGSLTLGGNLSLAVGPLGRTGEALGALNTKGRVAAMYSYSKTKGTSAAGFS